MLDRFKIVTGREALLREYDLAFREVPNRVVLIMVTVNIFTVGIECERVPESEIGMYSLWTLLVAFFLLELLVRIRSQGFLFFREYWDLSDFISQLGCCMDLIEVLIYARPMRILLLRCLSAARALRFFSALIVHNFQLSRGTVFVLFYRTFKAMFFTMLYSIAFFFILSFIGAVLVTADVLPLLSILRASSCGNWMSARQFFGSILQSLFSMFEIITVWVSIFGTYIRDLVG